MKTSQKLIRIVLLFIINFIYVNQSFSAGRVDSLALEANKLASEGDDFVLKGSYREAENFYLKSIAIWSRIETYNEYRAYPYYGLAILYQKMGNYQKCIENFTKAETILLNARSEYRFLLGAIYSNLGAFFQGYGDYFKAITYFNKSIEILKNLNHRNEEVYSLAILGMAQTCYFQNKNQLAIEILKNYLKEKNAINKSQFEKMMGSCFLELGEYEKAVVFLEKSLAGYENKNEKYSETLLIAAKAYLRTRDLKKAEGYLNRAIPLLKEFKTEGDSWNIYYYDLLGQLFVKKAHAAYSNDEKKVLLGEALKVFDKALMINSNSVKGGIPYLDNEGEFITPTQVKDIFINRAKALGYIAKIYQNEGDVQLSRQFRDMSLITWEATVRFLTDFRTSFLEEESKLSLGEAEVNVYAEGFSAAREMYEDTGFETYFRAMLFYSESGKSSTFLSSLNTLKAGNFGGLPDSLRRIEKDLNMQLTSLKQMIFNEKNVLTPDSSLLKGWENNLFEMQKQHDGLMFRFENDYPQYYNFKYGQKFVTPDDIRSKLKDNQALVEYFVDEPESENGTGTVNALYFTHEGYTIHSTKIDNGYVKNLQCLLDQLSNKNVGETNLTDFREYVRSSTYLYSVLIDPLGIEKSINSLIIVPDGKLAYLPFDAIISAETDTTKISFSTPAYLVKRFNMVYSYSATLYFDYFKGKKRGRDNILAFAPEYSDVEVDINQMAYRYRQMVSTTLRTLPGARDEVSKLSKLYKCKAYIGQGATESAFKREAANYDILHLAMHTIMNDSIPMFSKLVFSNKTDTVEDGYLNTQEIYNMRLNARLAVLSACNTGSGQMRAGEGVMSMARAFLFAGCPSIVMTLWEVEDRSSAVLMLNFYRYLFKGYTKPEALRKAKLEHLKSADPLKSHPYFWMGYIIVGDPSAMKYYEGVIIFILIFIGVLFVFLFIVRKVIRGG